MVLDGLTRECFSHPTNKKERDPGFFFFFLRAFKVSYAPEPARASQGISCNKVRNVLDEDLVSFCAER